MGFSAVIVNYHTSSFIYTLLHDLEKIPTLDRIFIVDNSGDHCASGGLTQFYESKVEILKPDNNLGFGNGVNFAMQHVTSKWVLVINPDMRIPPGAVERLVDGAEQVGAVLAGPRFYWDDEKQFQLPPALGCSSWMDFALMSQSQHRLDADHLSFYWQVRHERFWQETEPFVEPFLSGACMLINRMWAMACPEKTGSGKAERYWTEIGNNSHVRPPDTTQHETPRTNEREGGHIKSSEGGRRGAQVKGQAPRKTTRAPLIFDPRFFMYYEDTDLAVRACNEGTPPVCIPNSEMIHYYNQSPAPGETKAQMMNQAHSRFKEKYYPTLEMNVTCEAHYIPDIVDLQRIGPSHRFEVQGIKNGGSHVDSSLPNAVLFEIGVTPFFIPFIQYSSMVTVGHSVQLSKRVWERLLPGEYFTRLRSPLKGVQKIWKWKKE